MVFSTIKFYGVPAGQRVCRDSLEKEVSTRCCEPSHAITTTLSWLSVPFYFAAPHHHHHKPTPQPNKKTGWHHNSCMFCSFVHFCSPCGFFPLLPLLVLWNGERRVAQNMEDSFCAGNLQAWRHQTKMERVISFFGRGEKGGSVGLQTFFSNMDLEHPLPIASQNAGPARPQRSTRFCVCNCLGAGALLLLFRILTETMRGEASLKASSTVTNHGQQ